MGARVIAEIGINHDGSYDKALMLIDGASESGCFGIKFQYRNLQNSYSRSNREIGDEILLSEITRSYLSPEAISSLADYARAKGLRVGISFFTTEDLKDFNLQIFDFFKIPSVELTNLPLIFELLKLGKEVLISLGMHSEEEIEEVLEEIKAFDNWILLHCVSNYPVANHNVQLGYIKHLSQKWNQRVGYSSHDENWENIAIALTLGATVIERHITLSRESEGLDHSSSSTISEFRKICRLAEEIEVLKLGNGPRVPNQGELLNKQNLGRSYFALKNLEAGDLIVESDFEYRSPLTGMGGLEFKKFIGKNLYSSVKKNEPITVSHVKPSDSELTSLELELARQMSISIPVRLGDCEKINSEMPVGSFEFHLSFEEVLSDLSAIQINQNDSFSVHLPDYIDSRNLINPWSSDSDIRDRSLIILKRTVEFADELGKKTKRVVPIVASLSSHEYEGEIFYKQTDELFREHNGSDSQLTLQWLPPIAWYFGGSVPLHVMNDEEAVRQILRFNIPITMDYSHLILSRNYFGFDAFRLLEDLRNQIVHIHICDAKGIDGEGMQIGEGDVGNLKLLETMTSFSTLKVIEVWQGHLNGMSGFKKAVRELVKFKEQK